MAQETVNIRLSPGLKKRITELKIESGDYSSISDYIREIIISDLAETRIINQISDTVSDALNTDDVQEILSDLIAQEIQKRLT